MKAKKDYDLPTDDRIVAAFGGFNFGDGSKDDESKVRTLARGLLESASGFSCGSSMREILARLRLARYRLPTLDITITAYGRRCILAAHKRLMMPNPTPSPAAEGGPVHRVVG